jgi:protoheme IX farnesyltransferase
MDSPGNRVEYSSTEPGRVGPGTRETTRRPAPALTHSKDVTLLRINSERKLLGVLRDYCRLTRPGIVAMVLVTMSVAALVAGPQRPPWNDLLHALVGAALAISGAIALNQRMEKTSDARMARTALRPLPSGRLTGRQAAVFGIVASAAGMLYLVVLAPPMVSWLTAASWIVYVWIYTPMKGLSAWQTPLGAVAGAMPTLMGAAAAGVLPTGLMPLVLFGIVYFWQFPHAMAIAWLYRADFAAANLRVASVVDPSGRIAARLALAGAIALLPVSVVPWFDGRAGWGYAAAAVLLGLGYLACAAAFWRRTDDTRARALLWGSLVYLPATCAALVWAVCG